MFDLGVVVMFDLGVVLMFDMGVMFNLGVIVMFDVGVISPVLHGTTFLEPFPDSAPCKHNRSRSRSGSPGPPPLRGLSPDSNPLPVWGPV